jgi:hypothetical protein
MSSRNNNIMQQLPTSLLHVLVNFVQGLYYSSEKALLNMYCTCDTDTWHLDTYYGCIWKGSTSGSVRRFGTGEAGAAPNSHTTGAASGHLREESEPFLGCIGEATNSSSTAPAPAPHAEPSARNPPKRALYMAGTLKVPDTCCLLSCNCHMR